MKAAACLAFLVGIWLASCGLGGYEVDSPSERIVVVWGVPPDGATGYTDWGDPTVVTMLRGWDRYYLIFVAEHELLHAVGLGFHLSDPSCFLYPEQRPYLPTELCPQEREAFLGVSGSFRAFCADEELVSIFREAAAFLNDEAGREVVEVGYR